MVDVRVSQSQSEVPAELSLLCPICQGSPVVAKAWEKHERLMLMHLVPLGPPMITTWVKCPGCRNTFLSAKRLEELLELPPADAAKALTLRASLPAQFLAVASIALCWIPIVGAGIGLVALAPELASRTWTRKASQIGVLLGLMITAGILYYSYMIPHGPPRGRRF